MNGSPAQDRVRRVLAPAILAGVVFASILLIGLTGWLIWQSGQREIARARSTTVNLVSVLERHTERMIDSVQMVMTTAAMQLGADSGDPARRSFLDAWLSDVARGLPHLHSVAVLDRPGGAVKYEFSSGRELRAETRDALLSSVAGQGRNGLGAGSAVFDEASATWLLPFARSVSPRHGNDTLVVVTLAVNYLQDLHTSLDIGTAGSVVLLRDDGKVLARRPHDPAKVGEVFSQGPLFRQHLPLRPAGTFSTLSPIDGVERILSYRKMENVPLVAVVTLSVAEVLSRWWHDLSVDLAIAGISACVLIGLGVALARLLRERDRANSHLRTTLDHMEQGLVMVGPDQRGEVYNRRAAELLELPEEMLARRPLSAEVFAFQEARGEFASLTPEERRSIVQPRMDEAPALYERTRPNGIVLEVRTTLLPDGGAVRTYTDITQRRRAVDDMNASVAFANSLINSSPDCIMLLDLEGCVTFISDLGQELMEIADFEPVRLRPFVSFFPEDTRPRIELALRRVRNGQTDRFSRVCPTLGGTRKWWEFIITPVHDTGRHLHRLFVVARDISERQAQAEELGLAKEAAERASQAKSQFLASMSHEIRTPLNAILGFAALAKIRHDGDPGLNRQIELIEKAGNALLTIINDVLDLAKIEAGKVELEERPLDLRGLAGDCMSLIGGLAAQKDIRLECTFEPEFPARIVADEDRLRQVLLNLLNNAVKFTPAGSVTLSVARCADGGRMQLAVSDTGIGIAPDRIAQLFEDFVQVDGSISRTYGGTGLGLSISRRLAALMGGDIRVASTVGAGSRFTVDLPLAVATSAADTARRAETAELATVAPRSILLVDDLSINLEIVGEMLTSAGHRVELAGTGPAAIAAYARNRHELILMDVQMPDMDGIETTRRIRALDQQGRTVPIIALTANVFAQQVESYRRAGMDDHLGKPFNRSDLLAGVARWTAGERGAASSEPQANEVPVLHQEGLAELRQLMGADKVDQLLQRFRDDLRARFRSADIEALKADAHALASSSGLLGFARLSQAARGLEDAIAANGDVSLALTGALQASRDASELLESAA